MAKKTFSIADYIAPEDVSVLDTSAAESIISIPVDRIAANAKNFYDTSDVDELVKSIELSGLIEPIIVKPSVRDAQFRNGMQFYEIISGHRRFKAYTILAKDDLQKWGKIPAIVREPKSELLEELLLIEANRATRILSAPDLMRQAERYSDLLANLKKNGVSIPGRLRDAVAEAMNVSATKLARLKKINDNLIPDLMACFDAGKINESVAYTLAQANREAQAMLYNSSGAISALPEWKVRKNLELAERINSRICPHGGDCDRSDYIFIGPNRKCSCSDNVCCHDCAFYVQCKVGCHKCFDEHKADFEKMQNTKSASAVADKEEPHSHDADNAKFSSRVSAAIHSVSRKSFNDALNIIPYAFTLGYNYVWDEDSWEDMLADDSFDAQDLEEDDILALAIAADTSFEYLIGLIDDPSSICAEATCYRWRDGRREIPPEGTSEYAEFVVLNADGSADIDYFRDGKWCCGDNEVRWWFPVPPVI